MPRYEGTVKRLRPRVNVMRGYTGNEPQSLSRSAPVASNTGSAAGAKQIYSGQAITLSGGKWVLADHTAEVAYIAYHDSDDTDVLSSGLLLGFSCLGEYELESAWFTNDGFNQVTGPDVGIQVSDNGAEKGYWTATGASDVSGTIIHGRAMAKTDLAVGGSGGNPSAFANMGEDDSSGFYGVAATPAAKGIWDITIAGDATTAPDTFAYTITLNGTDYAITATDWGSSNTATANAVLAKIEAAQSDPLLDAAIESVVEDGSGVITITTRAGTANNISVVGAYTDGGGTDPATGSGEVETQAGSDGASGTSKNVVRFVTTAS